MRICMFVKNSFEYDARVLKEATSLTRAGHHVTVVAIQVPGVTAQRETIEPGIDVVRVDRVALGMPFVQRVQAKFVVGVEERHGRMTGEASDPQRVRRLAVVQTTDTTATPGDQQALEAQLRVAEPTEARPGPLQRLWAKVTTPVLRAAAWLVRSVVWLVRGALIWPARALKLWLFNRRFIRAGLATDAQIWHAHDLNALYIGTTCKRRRPGTRLVYDSHELATQRSRMTKAWRRWAMWNERRGLRHVDRLIMTTRSRAEYMVDTYGIAFPTLIRNVPELMEVERWDLRERLGIAAADRIVLYQGSIQEHRGIEEAIEAVTKIDRAVLVVIGYGHHRPVLERMVRDRGLTEKVRFFGPIPNRELLFYTASADAGLCLIKGASLSYRWSLPNKLFEYMMAGIPTVASDYEEMGRVVRDEGVGTVCDPDDPDAVEAAIRTVLDDPDGFKAKTRDAVGRYHWGVEELVLIDLYDGLGSR